MIVTDLSLAASAGRRSAVVAVGLTRLRGPGLGPASRAVIGFVLALTPWIVVLFRPQLHVHLQMGLLIALGPPIAAVALTAIPGLSMTHRRSESIAQTTIGLHLAVVEWAIVVIALAFLIPFTGHLFADAYACRNGVTRAC